MSDVLLDIKISGFHSYACRRGQGLKRCYLKMHEGDVWASWARVEAEIRNCLFYNGPRSLSERLLEAPSTLMASNK